jgi:predicted XRE-type DNA-binding protein
MSKTIIHEIGSGNVFADLGLESPTEALAKAKIATRINSIIEEQGLTQKEAAKMLGLDQPKISALKRGHLARFSLERLLILLTVLDLDVDIVIHPKPAHRPSGEISVML